MPVQETLGTRVSTGPAYRDDFITLVISICLKMYDYIVQIGVALRASLRKNFNVYLFFESFS